MQARIVTVGGPSPTTAANPTPGPCEVLTDVEGETKHKKQSQWGHWSG